MSKIREKIRQKVSQGLDVLIPENRWEQYIELLDRDGKFTRKNMLMLAMVTAQQVEILENLVEELYFRLEMIEKPNGVEPTRSLNEGFKLRTKKDIEGRIIHG